jgi:hypothetical protein
MRRWAVIAVVAIVAIVAAGAIAVQSVTVDTWLFRQVVRSWRRMASCPYCWSAPERRFPMSAAPGRAR